MIEKEDVVTAARLGHRNQPQVAGSVVAQRQGVEHHRVDAPRVVQHEAERVLAIGQLVAHREHPQRADGVRVVFTGEVHEPREPRRDCEPERRELRAGRRAPQPSAPQPVAAAASLPETSLAEQREEFLVEKPVDRVHATSGFHQVGPLPAITVAARSSSACRSLGASGAKSCAAAKAASCSASVLSPSSATSGS